MIIDPSSPIGKVRLRCADYSDLPLFPDNVYQSVLTDVNGSIPQAAKRMAGYILGSLACQTHQKLAQMEIWGDGWFNNYRVFLEKTILNPNMMELGPIPFGAGVDCEHPLIQFQEDFNNNWASGTQSDLMHVTAQFQTENPYGIPYFI
jgi:hypothetical protein